MLPPFYQACLSAQLSQIHLITLQMLVELLQKERQVSLERLATLFAQPIQFESRRRNLQRFLILPQLSAKALWFPILKYWLLDDNKLGWLTTTILSVHEMRNEIQIVTLDLQQRADSREIAKKGGRDPQAWREWVMSEIRLVSTDAGIELTSSPEANPATPAWLGEVLLLGEYWRTTGLLERLQQQVKVSRGRMGQYEVCDFVLVLLAYAVSGVATLKEFFAQFESVASVVLSMWQRQQCPVASTLSRFLSAIEAPAVEALRTLFEADLLEHGFERDQSGGLMDRCGERFWVFDVDGTHQVARQRAVTQQADYPAVRRCSQVAVRPGYLGRKRGEGIRSRSAVSQAHTTEWLGTFGCAGNGAPGPDLDRACGVIQHYLQHHGISGNQAIVRLDGFYGTPQFVNRMQQHQLGYLLRCRDYSCLPSITLAQLEHQFSPPFCCKIELQIDGIGSAQN